MATKAQMIRLLRRDAKKKGQTFKECMCEPCQARYKTGKAPKMYGFVDRNSPKSETPYAVNELEAWFTLIALTEPSETKVTKSNTD